MGQGIIRNFFVLTIALTGALASADDGASASKPEVRIDSNSELKSYLSLERDAQGKVAVTIQEVEDQGFGRMGNLDVPLEALATQNADLYTMLKAGFYPFTSQANSTALPNLEDGISFAEAVNLGKKAWQIIQENRPIANLSTDFANALPDGVKDWKSLENWQPPRSKMYQVTYKNLLGLTVVNFSYRVLYTYGGGLNGRGKYLSHVTVMPTNLYVLWGFRFDADVNMNEITNAGTIDSPVGQAQMAVHWKLATVLQHNDNSSSYVVRGDGDFRDLTYGTSD